jgi:septum formation inhibitor MinC
MARRRTAAAKKKVKSKTKVMRKKRTAGKAARKRTGTTRKKPTKKTAKKALRQSTANKAKPPRAASKPKPIGPRAPQAARPTPSRPATPISSEQRIGVVTHYYSHLSVVAMQLEPGATLRVGDVIHIWGHTTDFTQKVESLEVNHAPVAEVGPKDDFGLKVNAHAREHDIVFKMRS